MSNDLSRFAASSKVLLVGLWVDRLEHRHQFCSGYDTIHLIDDTLAAGGRAILFKTRLHKGLLYGECLPFSTAFL